MLQLIYYLQISSFVDKLHFIVEIYVKKKPSKLVNQKVQKKKIEQKKRIYNFNTNPERTKNNNTNKKEKTY